MSENDRPVWLLDVDGVLNAPKPGWSCAPFTARIEALGWSWRFRFAPPLIAHVRQFALDGNVEIRWATTWIPWREELERTFRLPEFPVAFPMLESDEDVSEAKLHAAYRVLEVEQRPLIWTDDEVVPHPGTSDHARLVNGGLESLLVRPAERNGLQPEHIRQIQEFIARHTSR